jgi:predicted phosphohydrolase
MHHSFWTSFAFDDFFFTHTTTFTVFNVSETSWASRALDVRAIFRIVDTRTTISSIINDHHTFWTFLTFNNNFFTSTAALFVWNVHEISWTSVTNDIRTIIRIIDTFSAVRIILFGHHTNWADFTNNLNFLARAATFTSFNVFVISWTSITLDV